MKKIVSLSLVALMLALLAMSAMPAKSAQASHSWTWTPPSTTKKTGYYTPSATTDPIYVVSSYGEPLATVWDRYQVSAELHNNTVWDACYVSFVVRLFKSNETYQDFTGGTVLESLTAGSSLPAAASIMGSVITGGVSSVIGYAILGGDAMDCETGQTFSTLPITNTSKTAVSNGINYAGTITNNNGTATANTMIAVVVRNSNGTLRYTKFCHLNTYYGENSIPANTSDTFLCEGLVTGIFNQTTSYIGQATWYN